MPVTTLHDADINKSEFVLLGMFRDTVTKQVSVLGSLREEEQAQWGGMRLCFGVAVVWKSKECLCVY